MICARCEIVGVVKGSKVWSESAQFQVFAESAQVQVRAESAQMFLPRGRINLGCFFERLCSLFLRTVDWRSLCRPAAVYSMYRSPKVAAPALQL